MVEAGIGFHLREERDSFLGLADSLVGDAKIELCGGVGLAKGESELVLVDGFLQMSAVGEDDTESDVRRFGRRHQADDLLEVRLGGGEIVVIERGSAGAIKSVCLAKGVGGDRSLRERRSQGSDAKDRDGKASGCELWMHGAG